jgi:hypothetical protein
VITRIIAQLKTGLIKNVVPYGNANTLAPPYIVVRPEKDPLDRGRIYRIFIHMQPGQQTFLEDYAFKTVPDLLSNYSAVDRHSNRNTLLQESEYGEIIDSNDDGTISMERRFLVPQLFI